MFATATYTGEDIRVKFRTRMERNDFGVPRSPTWWEPVTGSEEIEDLEILGVAVDPKALPKDLLVAIYDLADGLEWEGDVE